MPSSYAIGPHFETFIKNLIETGRYSNASEAVRAGLRLLEDRERDLALRRAEFDRLIEEGLADLEAGRTIPAEEVFAGLRKMLNSARRDAAE